MGHNYDSRQPTIKQDYATSYRDEEEKSQAHDQHQIPSTPKTADFTSHCVITSNQLLLEFTSNSYCWT